MSRRPTFGDPGRPAKPAAERARNNAGIWLDDATFRDWKRRASAARGANGKPLSLGEWIRRQVARSLKRDRRQPLAKVVDDVLREHGR